MADLDHAFRGVCGAGMLVNGAAKLGSLPATSLLRVAFNPEVPGIYRFFHSMATS